jgi:hypothetical protein
VTLFLVVALALSTAACSQQNFSVRALGMRLLEQAMGDDRQAQATRLIVQAVSYECRTFDYNSSSFRGKASVSSGRPLSQFRRFWGTRGSQGQD